MKQTSQECSGHNLRSFGEGQQAVLVQKPVQASIALTPLADEACQGEREKFAHVPAFLVDLPDVQLHRAVLLGCDELVRCGALAGKVEINNTTFVVLHGASD